MLSLSRGVGMLLTMGYWRGMDSLWALVLLIHLAACQHLPVPPMRRVSGWGSVWGLPAQSRQLSSQQPLSVLCQEEQMVLTVPLDLFGNGKLVLASGLSLGPQRCPPSSQDGGAVLFQYPLQACGNQLQMSAEYLMYSSVLSYSPSSSSVITRTNPAAIPIRCFYPRHGNVSSNPIRPTWIPFSTTLTSEERLSFQLHLMKDDWSDLRNAYDYTIGEPMYIQASVDVTNHMPMRILVDSCVAVLSPDVHSNPQYKLLSNNGCLMDSKEDSSIFISPRPKSNILQFIINAFRFVGSDKSLIYIYCDLRAVPTELPADPTNKACYYRNTWAAVEGSSGICSCCESGNCGLGSSSTGLRPGSRRHWKRQQEAEAELEQEVRTMALGPLYIIGPVESSDGGMALAVHADSEQGVKPWMVAAVGSLWVVVVVGAVLTWRRRNGKPPVTHVQQ